MVASEEGVRKFLSVIMTAILLIFGGTGVYKFIVYPDWQELGAFNDYETYPVNIISLEVVVYERHDHNRRGMLYLKGYYSYKVDGEIYYSDKIGVGTFQWLTYSAAEQSAKTIQQKRVVYVSTSDKSKSLLIAPDESRKINTVSFNVYFMIYAGLAGLAVIYDSLKRWRYNKNGTH